MPEILEIEAYRTLAVRTVGRRITGVVAPDPWFLKGGVDEATVAAAVVGRCVDAVRRTGKVLFLDLDAGPTLGLRFGMTGRLVVDGEAAIDALQYGPARDDPGWERFRLTFDGGGALTITDPRRLGAVILDPDESRLGVDVMAVTRDQLAVVLDRSHAPLKARLMDQARLAGLGNLLTDESLWRAGLDPARPAGSLDEDELAALHQAIGTTLETLGRRGGSHTGDLQAHRVPGATCPLDGAPLERRVVGGRTTYSCPHHQR